MIRRVALFFTWGILCLVLFFLAFFVTQFGDCFDVQRCSAFKDRAAVAVVVVVPAIWLVGCAFMIRRWNR